MAMINVALHGKNIYVVLLTNLGYQFLKSGLQPIYQEYLSSIARAKNKVIVHHGYCGGCTSIFLFHVSIISQIRNIRKRQFARLSSHGQRPWGFPADFSNFMAKAGASEATSEIFLFDCMLSTAPVRAT